MLESLENNEVILLMYLADELPLVDRQEVEQMLAGDSSLRRELDGLRAAQELFEDRLARLDDVETLSSQMAMTRRISRAMRQHFADRAARAAKAPAPLHSRAAIPLWVYPTAAAAILFLAFIFWVANFGSGSHRMALNTKAPTIVAGAPDATQPANGQPANAQSDPDPKAAQLAQEIEASFGPSTEKDDNQMLALRVDPRAALWSDQDE
jgi:anti-sigma factor RsiW